MPDAAYYRMKAKECFDRALETTSPKARANWQQRGREYGELAVATDAETGKGAGTPDKPAAKRNRKMNGVKRPRATRGHRPR
jgi:hypothetical protein